MEEQNSEKITVLKELRRIYRNRQVSAVISGSENFFGKTMDESKQTLCIDNGGVNILRQPEVIMNETEFYYDGPSYGVITVWNKTAFTYEHKNVYGDNINVIDYVIDNPDDESSASSRREGTKTDKMIGIVVLICSIAFLGYFIYSWVSCYIKKPRVLEEGQKDGYSMAEIQTSNNNNQNNNINNNNV